MNQNTVMRNVWAPSVWGFLWNSTANPVPPLFLQYIHVATRISVCLFSQYENEEDDVKNEKDQTFSIQQDLLHFIESCNMSDLLEWHPHGSQVDWIHDSTKETLVVTFSIDQYTCVYHVTPCSIQSVSKHKISRLEHSSVNSRACMSQDMEKYIQEWNSSLLPLKNLEVPTLGWRHKWNQWKRMRKTGIWKISDQHQECSLYQILLQCTLPKDDSLTNVIETLLHPKPVKNIYAPFAVPFVSTSILEPCEQVLQWSLLLKPKEEYAHTVTQQLNNENIFTEDVELLKPYLDIDDPWIRVGCHFLRIADQKEDHTQALVFISQCLRQHYEKKITEAEVQTFAKQIKQQWKQAGYRFLLPQCFFTGEPHKRPVGLSIFGAFPYEKLFDGYGNIVYRHVLIDPEWKQKCLDGIYLQDSNNVVEMGIMIQKTVKKYMEEHFILQAFLQEQFEHYVSRLLHKRKVPVNESLLSLYILQKTGQWLRFWGESGYGVKPIWTETM